MILAENRVPFGRMVGAGTIICGISLVVSGCLTCVSEKMQLDTLALIGSVVLGVGLVVGLALSFYAMLKYNKGIF